MTRKYVDWSPEEWERLADLTWAIRSNSKRKHRLIPIVKAAVLQLPQDRRRHVNSKLVKRLEPMLEDRDRLWLGQGVSLQPFTPPSHAAEPEVETPKKWKASLLESQDTAELVGELAKRAVRAFSGRGSSLLDVLIATLSKGESVADAVILAAQAIATAPTPVKEKPVAATPAPAPTKPVIDGSAKPPVDPKKKDKVRVVLVGGLAIQQQEVASRIADIAKIRFIDKNQVTDLGLSNGSQDIIAIMSSFVDHGLVRQIENKANGARILQLKGNASGVSRDLRAAILDPNYRPCYHS